jgi:hypothetical protein
MSLLIYWRKSRGSPAVVVIASCFLVGFAVRIRRKKQSRVKRLKNLGDWSPKPVEN